MKTKIALVTGGTGGIGRVICKKLAGENYFVYINSRKGGEKAEHLLEEIKADGGECRLLNFDVCSDREISGSLKYFRYEHLDLLVNNAGFLIDRLISQIDMNEWNSILNTNFFGAVDVYRIYREKLYNAKHPRVINIGSISGVRPRPGQGAYAISKTMLIEWTKEKGAMPGDKIKYYIISPGPVNTEMIQGTKWSMDAEALKRIPISRFIEPQEIADLVYLAAANDVFTSGLNIIYDGGFTQTLK